MARNGLQRLRAADLSLQSRARTPLVAFAGYFLFGGLKLFAAGSATARAPPSRPRRTARSRRRHWMTLGVIAALILSVSAASTSTSAWARFSASVDPRPERRRRRWRGDQADAVEGDRDGLRRHGADRAARAGAGHRPARVAGRAARPRQDTVTGVVAFLTGVVSVYSSTSGVVLPAFLPMVPGLAAAAAAARARSRSRRR